jgi:hypothetical protein
MHNFAHLNGQKVLIQAPYEVVAAGHAAPPLTHTRVYNAKTTYFKSKTNVITCMLSFQAPACSRARSL